MASDVTETYTIADLARAFDITARTLRFYEDQGLITPTRAGQTRLYSKADRARLAWILRGKRVGFSIAEISEMLNLYSLEDGRARQREVTLQKCLDRITALKAQRDDINSVIKELSGFCDDLSNTETDPATGTLLDSRTGEPIIITAPHI